MIIAPSLENDYLLVSDSQKIFTILQSLLFTAYKRSYKGSIIITYEIRDNEKIIFMVTDEGHPLPKNFAKDILSSNWIENTKKVYSESFGISLTNKLSSFFGSGFNITQQEDGTSISFEVKAKILKRKGQSLPKASQDSINLTDCRILIVEDIKINYIILKRILQKKGAKIEWAIDGQEAIEKVTKSMYDIILMDIQMPNMNGIEATQKIRKLGIHTPIIAQTANILADDKDICLEAGCDDYIGKPINALDLIDKVASYIKS